MTAPSHSSDLLSEDYIHGLLKPLQQEHHSADYRNQYKAVMEFNYRLHSLATLFADLYSKASTLEQEIAKQKTTSS